MKLNDGGEIEIERISFIGQLWTRILSVMGPPGDTRELIRCLLLLFENGEISLELTTQILMKLVPYPVGIR